MSLSMGFSTVSPQQFKGNILSKINQDVFGILWISPDSSQISSEVFHSLDYLCDGLLKKAHLSRENNNFKNLFITDSYGSPFFIGQIHNIGEMNKDIDEVMELVEKISKKRKNIIIFNETETPILSKLKKSYKKYNFENAENLL